ncbi:MAG TPA: chemotaxis protein CheA [Candidatus Angelobacter sp.]|nr:chemotaxis protein CheA [Candidatus Angelobacter sp.]
MDFDREAVLASFLEEAKEGLDVMEQSLLELESGTSSTEPLHDIFRSAHTIKGNASALELTALAEFSHVVEDLLDVLREHETNLSKEAISLLLEVVDELRVMIPAAAAGADLTPQQEKLKKRIAKEVKKRAGHGATSSPLPELASPASAIRSEAFSGARTLRADIARLDRMLDLTGEIVVTNGRLRRALEELGPEQARQALEVQQEAERLFMDLQGEVMRVRMVAVGPMFRQLARAVRDMAANHDKIARLEISGADVEVDNTVLEHLKDPLLHMIRNAIDHGIERPEVRKRLGKDACGLIRLSAAHSSGSLVVRLQDDGAGLDRKRIVEKAQRSGLLAAGEIASDQELHRLVFKAGFSTAETVTDLSGRGVGLDVVQRNIDALRGTIDISSEEGAGTAITIRLPLTLAIIEGFSVMVGQDTFVIPMDYVTECTELGPDERNAESSGIFNLRGSAVPYVRLREAFGTPGESLGRENVVVVQVEDFRAGIAVDHLLGDTQAVIKPLGKMFRGAAAIAGSTILSDGTVGLIIDVPGLLRGLTQSNLQPQLG